MKLFKRLMAVMFALTLTLGMGTRVYAEETTYTITINKNSTDKAAHTYDAYRIFTGKLETVNGKDVLSDINWGGGVTPATVITELNKIDGFNIPSTASAADVAKAIGDKAYTEDSVGAQKIADAINAALTETKAGTVTIAADATSGVIENLTAGYYFVKDTAAVSGEGATTRYILEVVKNVTVDEKANVPSVQKKVKEKDDNTGVESVWQDGADYDIGDDVPFQIKGTTAAKADEYYKYHVTFVDDQSNGLAAPENFKITVLEKELTLKNEANASATATVEPIKITAQVLVAGADFQIKVTFENTANVGKTEGLVKLGETVKSKDIVVEYTSKLTGDAVVIGTPGNPNEVYMKFSNNPNLTDDREEGQTPKDKVIVFTYQINALKVEPDGAAITQEEYDAKTAAQKADYVKVGDKWQKTKALSGAGFTLYKKVNGAYTPVGEEIKGVTTFEFKGTDAGEYKLVETTVPGGYNKADDIEIKVEATYDTDSADPKLKTLSVTPETAGFTVTTTTIEGDAEHITTDGIISGKILNQKGSTLPSTGGIGTTIFYVLGGLLVAGAGIVLVARKKAAE